MIKVVTRPDGRGGDPAGRIAGGRGERIRGWIAGCAVLVVVAVVLAVHNLGVERIRGQRAPVLRTAEKVALEVSSIGGANAGQRLRVLAGESTGGFAAKLGRYSGAFEEILGQAQVSSRARVTGAGVESIDADTASVLVAVAAAVTNSRQPGGVPMHIRLHVQLQRVGQRWLAAGVDDVT